MNDSMRVKIDENFRTPEQCAYPGCEEMQEFPDGPCRHCIQHSWSEWLWLRKFIGAEGWVDEWPGEPETTHD